MKDSRFTCRFGSSETYCSIEHAAAAEQTLQTTYLNEYLSCSYRNKISFYLAEYLLCACRVHLTTVYSFPNDKILDWTKFKGFADNKLNGDEMN